MGFEELKKLDQNDPLAHFRDQFHIPKVNGQEVVYFCGNSLGLQPKSTKEFLNYELDAWKRHGVKGHFIGDKPWVSYHELAKKSLSELVGAKQNEVQAVGSLTTNLHLLLASFYQPNGMRLKVIIESGAFPSDFYAVHSHMQMKGIDPEKHLIELRAKDGGGYLPNEEIVDKIEEIGVELALVLMPGVQYYSGQFFNLPQIAEACHSVGAFIGFDLAHTIGNLPLEIHNDQVDFAVWCSYKYLNSGPGGIGGMFIHEKHSSNLDFPRLSGWWGHKAKDRFEMVNRINPIPNIDGWQLSNANILSAAAHLASLSIFDKAGIKPLREKSIKMIGWLEVELNKLKADIEVITPGKEEERGCQLSIFIKKEKGKRIFDYLDANNVIVDWREPNVVRVAPVPLYSKYEELGMFIGVFKRAFSEIN